MKCNWLFCTYDLEQSQLSRKGSDLKQTDSDLSKWSLTQKCDTTQKEAEMTEKIDRYLRKVLGKAYSPRVIKSYTLL